MENSNQQSECNKDALLINALYKWGDAEHEARKAGEPMLAFFIALVLAEIKLILNTPHS